MTAQCRERLIYNGNEYYLATEPLFPYLKKHNFEFQATSTACWRGYRGKWIIEDNKLFLVDLEAYIPIDGKRGFGGKEVRMDYLFPGEKKVLADWFSGEIRIPHGEMMNYVHQGYASLYEKELFLMVESGIVVSEREIDNTHYYKDREAMEVRALNDTMEAIFGGKLRKPLKKKNWLDKLIERFLDEDDDE